MTIICMHSLLVHYELNKLNTNRNEKAFDFVQSIAHPNVSFWCRCERCYLYVKVLIQMRVLRIVSVSEFFLLIDHITHKTIYHWRSELK